MIPYARDWSWGARWSTGNRLYCLFLSPATLARSNPPHKVNKTCSKFEHDLFSSSRNFSFSRERSSCALFSTLTSFQTSISRWRLLPLARSCALAGAQRVRLASPARRRRPFVCARVKAASGRSRACSASSPRSPASQMAVAMMLRAVSDATGVPLGTRARLCEFHFGALRRSERSF